LWNTDTRSLFSVLSSSLHAVTRWRQKTPVTFPFRNILRGYSNARRKPCIGCGRSGRRTQHNSWQFRYEIYLRKKGAVRVSEGGAFLCLRGGARKGNGDGIGTTNWRAVTMSGSEAAHGHARQRVEEQPSSSGHAEPEGIGRLASRIWINGSLIHEGLP